MTSMAFGTVVGSTEQMGAVLRTGWLLAGALRAERIPGFTTLAAGPGEGT
jgi:hypothetical protein